MKRKKYNPPCLLAAGLSLVLAAGLSLSACRPAGARQADWDYGVLAVPGGYGYVVFRGTDTLIRQTCIPAVGRRRPFATPADAGKVARRVCGKLRSGQSPALTPDEVEAALSGREAGR